MWNASPFQQSSAEKAGLSPGTMTYIGAERRHTVNLTVFQYDEKTCEEMDRVPFGELRKYTDNQKISWINIDGIHDLDKIRDLGSQFSLHSLILEDVVNTTQRPKVEKYDNGLFLILKMIRWEEDEMEPDFEQISLFLGKGFVICFQEKPEDILESLRERLRNSSGRLRKRREDYLFYAIIDLIISHYFKVIEKLEEQIDQIEEKMAQNAHNDLLSDIQHQKRTIIYLRKYISPLREVIYSLSRDREKSPFEKGTQPYLRDLQDQLIRITELIETYREILANLFDLHFAINGQKMNEIMKVLTVVASIFIPLTFVAGVYGMNFQNMPELSLKYGYFGIWALMLFLALGMILYFRKKKWL